MVIQHNLESMFANTQLNKTLKDQKVRTERLSSGYRVNRAADDAAGLTISEKMRWQIRGLNRAAVNAQDGMSMIQVADGALEEMHSVLQRMNELATQAANDTNTIDDRKALQSEIGELQKEINKISKETMFNTFPLLDTPALVDIEADDYSSAKLDKPMTIGGVNYPHTKAMDFSKIDSSNLSELPGKTFKVHCSQGCSQTFTFAFTDSEPSGVNVTGSTTRPDVNVTININDVSNGKQLAQKIYDLAASKNDIIANADPTGTQTLPSGTTYIGHDNGMMVSDGKLTFLALDSANFGYIEAVDLGSSDANYHLQVGALKGQAIEVGLKTINCTTLGIGGLDVSSFEHAGNAMADIQEAINRVSEHRSYFGAISNRLEHTIRNLENTSENTQAAESQIRDTDMAKEMVSYSKNSILAQTGQTILAQTNSAKQNVVNLLQ